MKNLKFSYFHVYLFRLAIGHIAPSKVRHIASCINAKRKVEYFDKFCVFQVIFSCDGCLALHFKRLNGNCWLFNVSNKRKSLRRQCEKLDQNCSKSNLFFSRFRCVWNLSNSHSKMLSWNTINKNLFHFFLQRFLRKLSGPFCPQWAFYTSFPYFYSLSLSALVFISCCDLY